MHFKVFHTEVVDQSVSLVEIGPIVQVMIGVLLADSVDVDAI